EQHHTELVYLAAKCLARQAVSEFVTDLGQTQCQPEITDGLQCEEVPLTRQPCAELFPARSHQNQGREHQPETQREARSRKQSAQPAQDAAEEPVRIAQGKLHAEEIAPEGMPLALLPALPVVEQVRA